MPNRRQAPADRAERALRRRIADGLLPAGARLPAEAPLAAELAVSRTALRRAFARLEADGLLVHQPGRGREVATGLEAFQRPAHGVIGLLTPHVPGIDEVRGIHVGSTTAVQVAVLHALAAAGFNALQFAPSRLAANGLSPHLADLVAGAIALFEATRLHAVRGFIDECQREAIPLVVQADGLDLPGADRVLSDHQGGTELLVAELAGLGCRRIQRLWDHNTVDPWPLPWIPLRDRGYERACTRLGLPVLPAVVAPIPNGLPPEAQVAAAAAAQEPLVRGDARPDALLLLTDGVVGRHTAALHRLGLDPNRDIAVAGFDRYWDHRSERFEREVPPLLSVDKRNPAIGRELVAVLEQRLATGAGDALLRRVPARLERDPGQLRRWRDSRRG